MLEKTMKQILIKKINDWVSTITDEEVKTVIKKDLIITGGCFTSMIQNETPKDYDCYFRTKESVLKVAHYYVDKWNNDKKASISVESYSNDENLPIADRNRVKIFIQSKGIEGNPEEAHNSEELGIPSVNEVVEELDETKADEIIEKEKKPYYPVFFSSNAITLSDGIQIVVRFYGEPSDIHDTYDFEHTKAYYDNKTKEIVIPKKVYEMVVNKTLKYTGSKYPVASLFRLRKFINRGWTINAGQILLIAMQVSDLNLQDIDTLSEQLIGVDSLYFMQLIEQFRKQKEENPNFELTTNYVMSIVDKIF
jgi:aryl carrier-like protein